jgi:uracil-DNA glycosylase family 4
MSKVVEPDGPEDAAIVILGEAPGEEEIREGRPFVGPSGQLLFDQILPRAGIRRDQCRTLNVHWEMPPGRKWETIPKDALGTYDTPTEEAILEYPRKVVIAVGGHALDFMLKGTAKVPRREWSAITKWRGSVLRDNMHFIGPVVVPMIHPAAVLRSGGYDDVDEDAASRKANHYKALCIHDAMRAKKVVDDPESMVAPERTSQHAGNRTFDGLRAELRHWELEDHDVPIAFDIETFAHTVTCIGIAASATAAIVVPLTEIEGWSVQMRAELVDLVATILAGPNPKIGQHLDYDVQHLARMGIPVNNVWLDTAVAHSILHPEIPHDLATLTSLYTLQPFFKEMREESSKEAETGDYNDLLWGYNGLDCMVTWEIGMKLSKELGL